MVPGWQRFPGVGNGNPLQYSCLENSIDRRAWWSIVHEVAKSQTDRHTDTDTQTHRHTHTHTHTHTHLIIICQVLGTPPHTHTLSHYMPGTRLPGSTGLSLYLLSSLSELNLNHVFSNRPALNHKSGHTVPYELSEYLTFIALQLYLIICLMFITSNLHIYVLGNFWIKKKKYLSK